MAGRIGSRGLFRFLLAVTVAGIALPLVSVVLKLAAADFHLWHRALERVPAAGSLVSAHPLLDISRTMPWLAAVSWHQPTDGDNVVYYVRYVVFNALVLAGLLLWRRRIGRGLERIVAWYHQPGHRHARRVILGTAIVMVFTYQTKAHLGFWFSGIAGWTYANWEPRLSAAPPTAAGGPVPPFATSAVLPHNARFLPGAGYLDGPAMFLHFDTGEVLPANYELVDLVFPEYVFGRLYREMRAPDVFADIVKASLGTRRRNRRFLVPLPFAYPNHAPYMPVEYGRYPPASALNRISFWELTLHIASSRRVEVVSSVQLVQVDVR